ncbi:hypothetical protein L1049_020734 [Liquidambar formosana]|uniref:Ubiquitin-like protease family profile domain-containing protein n=1 Tax=Liquidambar formosana TaxID=63359 RepID=A0AAP0SBT5_LIQFO
MINVYGEILMEEVIKKAQEHKMKRRSTPMPDMDTTFIFTSLCWTLVNEYGEATGGLKGELIDDLLYDACHTHRYVMFPINSLGKRKNLDHWTLLVFDTHAGVWMHYNSLRP